MPPSKVHVLRRPLIVATTNPGKLREFRALLSDLPFDLYSLGDLGLASAVGWVLALIMLTVSLVQLRLTGATNE